MLFCLCACSSLASLAEGLSDLPVKVVNGRKYYYYKVLPKETVYSLSRRFGVSREDFLRYNPSVADGLKIDQELVFPFDESVTSSLSGNAPEKPSASPVAPPQGTIGYVVQAKDTAYGISKRFGMSLEEFYSLNPTARDYGVKTDETVYVRNNQTAVTSLNTVDAAGRYEVRRGDTFYSIARAHGLSAGQLQSANPQLSVLVPGQFIVIPQGCAENQETPEIMPFESNEPVSPAFVPDGNNVENAVTVALALPFMLEQQPRSRQANLYTEFYKGFLIAVDSMRNCGKPIRVLAYDTNGTASGVDKIIADPALASAQVIIGPDDVSQVETLARYAHEHGASLLNIFAVKDESYKTLPNVMNSIVPHATMYAKAVNYFVDSSDGYTPVILNRIDGQHDKSEFISMLKARLDLAGREYVEIEFEKKLSSADLEGLSSAGKYAFIPMSSKLAEIKAVLPELSMFAQTFSSPGSIRLWGYPEWLSFRGDPLQGMYKLNACIFSRFYNTGGSDSDAEHVNEQFAKWYGGDMINVIPSQGLYGFDTGMYLINALLINGGDFSCYTPVYDGVQNCFNFVRSGDVKGWVNNEMFIISYTPDKFVRKHSL